MVYRPRRRWIWRRSRASWTLSVSSSSSAKTPSGTSASPSSCARTTSCVRCSTAASTRATRRCIRQHAIHGPRDLLCETVVIFRLDDSIGPHERSTTPCVQEWYLSTATHAKGYCCTHWFRSFDTHLLASCGSSFQSSGMSFYPSRSVAVARNVTTSSMHIYYLIYFTIADVRMFLIPTSCQST